jgi:hypothetical protein
MPRIPAPLSAVFLFAVLSTAVPLIALIFCGAPHLPQKLLVSATSRPHFQHFIIFPSAFHL